MALDVTDPTALAEAVKGKSDEEIIAMAQGTEGGINGLLDQLFEGMVQGFRPDLAGDKSAVIQYELDTPDGVRPYTVTVANGKAQLNQGVAESPRITMVTSFQDWLRLATQELDGLQAFTSGKLKIRGDLMFGQTMQNWFGEPGS